MSKYFLIETRALSPTFRRLVLARLARCSPRPAQPGPRKHKILIWFVFRLRIEMRQKTSFTSIKSNSIRKCLPCIEDEISFPSHQIDQSSIIKNTRQVVTQCNEWFKETMADTIPSLTKWGFVRTGSEEKENQLREWDNTSFILKIIFSDIFTTPSLLLSRWSGG